MPNWCTGDLKVRGKYKDIKEFLSKEMIILGGSPFNREYKEPLIDESCGIEIKVGNQGMWFRNAYRSYFENNIDIWIDDELKENDSIITLNLGELQTAWGTDTKALTKLSKQYNRRWSIRTFITTKKLIQYRAFSSQSNNRHSIVYNSIQILWKTILNTLNNSNF